MENIFILHKKIISSITLSLLLLLHFSLSGSTTATATVTYTVGSIDSISVSGNPGSLSVSSAVAGSAPTNATDATTTYAVTTNNSSREITAALASNMPTGVTLSVSLAAPSGATSEGAVSLSTTGAQLVSGISNLSQGSLSVTYTLAATVSASQVSGATNTVTYTIGP